MNNELMIMKIIIIIAILVLLFVLSITAVFKDVSAKILFWLYTTIALICIGYSISIVFKDVFYFTSYDILRIVMSLIVLIVPAILTIKPIRKKWIRGLLYALQIVVIYVVLGCIFLTIEPRPLSKTAIEKQVLIQMPKYKIVKFNFHIYRIFKSDCNGEQILKLKGSQTEFYKDLDSLSRTKGTGWDWDKELMDDEHFDYEFSTHRMDDEHFDRSEYEYQFFTMKVSKTDNKVYIEFWNT